MEAIASKGSYALSRHRAGSVREALLIFAPLMFSVFSGSLMSFCDRLFVSHYSLISLKAVTAAHSFCLLFQLGISHITAAVQICIGASYGERRVERLGPYCWQMIWFSFLSMIVTLPTGLGLTSYLFGAGEISGEGSAYFTTLMYGNFLFPLGTALSAYFTGLGKTKVVGICSFGAQIANVGLNYLLIFGIIPGISPLGARGAALGTLFSQALLCLALFILFLKERQDHHISKWRINKALFKEVALLGLPRSLARSVSLVSWSMTIQLVVRLGGDYLLVLSVGSSLWLVYAPIFHTLEQVLVTQVAFYRGKKEYSNIWKSVRSSITLLLTSFFVLGFFFLFCLDPFLSFFLHEPLHPKSLATVKLSCLWLWIFFFLDGLNLIIFGLVSGLGLTWFRLRIQSITSGPLPYLFFYFAFCRWQLSPDKIWMFCWSCMLFATPIGFIKAKSEIKKLATSVECERSSALSKKASEGIV